jgi:Anthrone oxygenase
MKKLILFLSIICASGLTMINIYNGVIDAQSWASDIPASIQTARDYFQHVDPRRFYTIVGPVNEVLILLTIILFWKDAVSLRIYFATSFLMYSAIVALTVVYFLPRNSILFTSSIPDHLDQIKAAAAQWSHMNWLRSLLGLVGVLFSFKGLDTYYQIARQKQET